MEQAIQLETMREQFRQLTGNDRSLTDFEGTHMRKSTGGNQEMFKREIENLKWDKKNLENDLIVGNKKYEDIINKLKGQIEDTESQGKKKVLSKERRIKELEETISCLE